jgi:hypothetical protein
VAASADQEVQDLRVLGAVIDGDDVIVSVYGGVQNVCGTVRFVTSTVPEGRRILRLAERWAGEDQLVTLVAADDAVSLFVEQEAFERACATA